MWLSRRPRRSTVVHTTVASSTFSVQHRMNSNQVLFDNLEKARDDLDEEATTDILNETTEEESAAMPESVNASQSDSGLHYQFRNSDNGQVTYRVVQVGGDENNQQATLSIVTTNGILNQLSQDENGTDSASQVAIVGNPFNDSGNEGTSSTGTTGGNTRFAYFQGAGGNNDLPSPPATGSTTPGQTQEQMLAGGQFYVMMSPDIIQGQGTSQGRTMISRNQFAPRGEDGSRNTRDDTRRVQHNEVERRRRDKINTWIMKLATIIPDCANDHTKQGQSKGGILSKACDHIVDLHSANQQLSESLKDYEQMQINFEVCRRQYEEAKQKIEILTQTLQANGIEVTLTSQAQQ